MKTKQVIQRNLPLKETYQLKSISRGSLSDGKACICDNCNALITNIATVCNSRGDAFQVGLDCAETLSGISGTENFETERYVFRQADRFLSLALLPSAAVCDNSKLFFYVEAISDKGKKLKAETYLYIIEKYLPDFKEFILSKSQSL